MRPLAVLTAFLVLLAPLAASQSGDDSGSSSSSSSSSSPRPTSSSNSTSSGPSGNATEEGSGDDGTEEAECPLPERRPMSEPEKVACYCRDNPRDPRCDRDDDGAEAEEAADEQAGEWRRWCRDEARADAQRDRCRQAIAGFADDQGRDRRITFTVDAANRTLLDYAIDGRVVLAAIALDTGSGNLTVHRAGSTLRLGDADTELVLHDDPTGLVRFKGADGSVTVRLAEGATVAAASDGSVARITFADGTVGHLRLGNATWIDGETVLAAGFFAFLLPPGQQERAAAGDGGDDDGDEAEAAEVEEKVGRAITRSRVGAEISVNAPAPAAAAALDGESGGTVDILAYDDVEVEVNVPSEAATPDAPIRVKVSAELDEGRTIVLNLDRSVLESAKAESLVLRYYDLYSQPDGTEVQTEVLFAQAAGLEDILDPSDDSGQPEYWVVEDANGVQVLVSVPHWSAHAVTIGSVLASNPSVLAGILVGLSGSAVAAAAMLWPRRREDEE